MDLFIKEIFRVMKLLDMVNTLEKLVNFTKEIEHKIKCTAKEKCAGKMEEYLKVFLFIYINKLYKIFSLGEY